MQPLYVVLLLSSSVVNRSEFLQLALLEMNTGGCSAPTKKEGAPSLYCVKATATRGYTLWHNVLILCQQLPEVIHCGTTSFVPPICDVPSTLNGCTVNACIRYHSVAAPEPSPPLYLFPHLRFASEVKAPPPPSSRSRGLPCIQYPFMSR